jgi:hypothetical protein
MPGRTCQDKCEKLSFVKLKDTKKPTFLFFVIRKYGKLKIGVRFLQNSFNWKSRFVVLK